MSDSPTTVRQRSTSGADDDVAGGVGYMPIEDDYLHHSGIRGGRSCCLCFFVTFLLLVAVVNALVTAGLFYLMSITHEGMQTLEFVAGDRNVHILSDVNVDNLVLHSKILGRRNKDVVIGGSNLMFEQGTESKLQIDDNATVVTGREFKLQTSTEKPLFSTDAVLNLDLYQVKNLYAAAVDVGSVTSREKFPDLHIESFLNAEIVGTEGVNIRSGRDMEIHAANHLLVGLPDNTMTLKSADGVYFSSVLPLEGKQPDLTQDSAHYKLCVCALSGKVFAVKETGQDNVCGQYSGSGHPCSQS